MITNTETAQEYQELLKSPEWMKRRNEIMKRDLNRCRVCGSAENLQVHHRQYHKMTRTEEFRKPWNYIERHLITLCHICHKRGHQIYRIPTFNV